MSANHAHFVGNLGRDGELRYTGSGTALLDFSVAVNERRGEEEATLWVQCALFGERAEKLAEYLTKGKQVYVAGRISEREWNDDAGVTHKRWSLVVNDLQLLGGPAGSNSEGQSPPRQNQQQQRSGGNNQQRGNQQRRQGGGQQRGGYRP